jgi:gluconolactonase
VIHIRPLRLLASITLAVSLLHGNDAATAILSDASSSTTRPDRETRATVERLDGAIDQIVPANPVLQKIATGFTWTEGPIWVRSGYLLFTNIPSDGIRKVTLEGDVTVFMQPNVNAGSAVLAEPKFGANGMAFDRSGRLTVAGNEGRDIWRLESLSARAQITILADTYEGKRLNSPNDLVYKSDGSLYFTDPPYGLTKEDNDPAKQLRVNGVYRIPKASYQKPGAAPLRSQLQLLVKDLPRPNGIAFSPDERYLYVDNSEPKKLWMRYRVKADGTLEDGEQFFDATSDTRPGSPDGIKVDIRGNVYSAGPAGVWVFSPGGKHLGTIVIPEEVGNLTWGGANGKTLYITASRSVYRITLNITGIIPTQSRLTIPRATW